MSTSKMGARVIFCGHQGYFIADIFTVGNVNIVRANGEISSGNIHRGQLSRATHQVVDFPVAGFWRPDLGVLVVPQDQVTELKTVTPVLKPLTLKKALCPAASLARFRKRQRPRASKS